MSGTFSSAIGTLRQATPEEILKAAQQTNDLQDWQGVIDFAKSLYGEQVYKAELQIDHNFDDGEENRYLVMIHAYDKQDNRLPYDLSLPFWSQQYYTGKTLREEIEPATKSEIERIKQYRRKPGNLSEEELAQAREEAIRSIVHDDLPQLSELDFYANKFYVDRPPLPNGEKPLTLYIQG
jgi:hypothetical protein